MKVKYCIVHAICDRYFSLKNHISHLKYFMSGVFSFLNFLTTAKNNIFLTILSSGKIDINEDDYIRGKI